MYVAYRCFDGDDDECISAEEVELVLLSVPVPSGTHEISEPGVVLDQEQKAELYALKRRDEE